MALEKQEILLDSGTNEVELVDLRLSEQSFGINAAKIREFIPYGSVRIAKVPNRPDGVAGVFLLRGRTIPLVELDIYLGIPPLKDIAQRVIVVTEFNNMVTAFVADEIFRIHRIRWSDFRPLEPLLARDAPEIIGSVSLMGREVLVLDLEHIVGQIFPRTVVNYDEHIFEDKPKLTRRGDAKVVFAEDSAIIRHHLTKILRAVGYTNLQVFENGQLALDALAVLKAKAEGAHTHIRKEVSVVVTDIEMPQLDGLTLCRTVKRDWGLDVPIIMFSSLLNDQMIAKCQKLGADGYVIKPETERLVALMDQYCFSD